MYSHILIDVLFVVAVSLIWFMLGYQSLLFFLGHRYYRQTRARQASGPQLADAELPAVTLLIPCHNEERVIAATLRAMLALDYPAEKLEILAIDDGSTDRTAAVARPFAADPRIRQIGRASCRERV